jgi:hypothetical protein
MKTSIFLFIFLTLPVVIKLEYYKGEGVIFPKEFKNYTANETEDRFTPTINQVIRAEKIMHSNYYNFKIKLFDSLKVSSKIDVKNSNPKTFIKHFKKFNRQYTGYCNEKKDSIIYIGLLNFENKKRIKPYFNNWKNEIFVCSGTFCLKNFRLCKVNLTTSKIIGI